MTHAIGGTPTIVGSYRIHTFLSSGTLTIDEAGDIEYLVVGGGGGGGGDHGGGGGGGEVKASTLTLSDVDVLAVVVGAGGTASPGRGTASGKGGSSSLGAIISEGGGYGGQYNNNPGGAGASGGGGASFGSGGGAGSATSNGVTGYNGYAGNNNGAGGGGGMGGAGGVGYASKGGAGVSSSISGAAVTYGGGGGGADSLAPNNPALGQDGGGNGNNRGTNVIGTAGAANRGGGGGGSGSLQVGTVGGSGIVIVRYLAVESGRRQIHTEDISFQSSPSHQYEDTKANIEALTVTKGAIAYATNHPTAPFGSYNGTTWDWQPLSSHAEVTLDTNADTILSLSGQALGLDTQLANTFWAGGVSGGASVPAFRSIVSADIPSNTVSIASLANASAQYKFLVSGSTPFAYAESAGFLNIMAVKTLAITNSLTLSGTDGTTFTFPALTGVVATLNTANVFTQVQTMPTIAVGSSFYNTNVPNNIKTPPAAWVQQTGTVSTGAGGLTVTGTGTLFTTEYKIGDEIGIDDLSGISPYYWAVVTAIASDVSMTTDRYWVAEASSNHRRRNMVFQITDSSNNPLWIISSIGSMAFGGTITNGPVATINTNLHIISTSISTRVSAFSWGNGRASLMYDNTAFTGFKNVGMFYGNSGSLMIREDNQFIYLQAQEGIVQLPVADKRQFTVTGYTTQTLPPVLFYDLTSATNTVRDVLQLETQSTGTAANNFGVGLLFSIETATSGTQQSAARWYAQAINNTNATRTYDLVGTVYDFNGEREGIRISADGTGAIVKLSGGLSLQYVAKTADYVITRNDFTIEWTANNCNGTLPTAVGHTQVFQLVNSGTGIITVLTTSGQTVQGKASGTITLSKGEQLTVQSNGTNYISIF